MLTFRPTRQNLTVMAGIVITVGHVGYRALGIGEGDLQLLRAASLANPIDHLDDAQRELLSCASSRRERRASQRSATGAESSMLHPRPTEELDTAPTMSLPGNGRESEA